VLTRPADLADDVVCAVVTETWEIAIRQIDYTRRLAGAASMIG
jgi:hypothetical protein